MKLATFSISIGISSASRSLSPGACRKAVVEKRAEAKAFLGSADC
jgi:hypothetical protein